ncbi:MAG: TM2 domain-containing protein [Bacilli bacterium]|jgi:TM2 domain-containing membrane protein YozV
MFCRKCGKEIPENVKYCPNCGCPVDPKEDEPKKETVNGKVVGDGTTGKSRLAGGLLNIFLPGIGRMYLGYVGIGVAQLLLAFVFGAGAIWSLIDGILILVGNVKYDGNGNPLEQ